MKITASASGGFAGLGERHVVDTATSAAGRTLEAAVLDSGFFAAAAAPQTGPVGADLVRWTITVEDGGHRQALTFTDDGKDNNQRWRDLLARIRALA